MRTSGSSMNVTKYVQCDMFPWSPKLEGMWSLFNQKARRSEPSNIKALQRVPDELEEDGGASNIQKVGMSGMSKRRKSHRGESRTRDDLPPPPFSTQTHSALPLHMCPPTLTNKNWTHTHTPAPGLVMPCLTGLTARREKTFQGDHLFSCDKQCLFVVSTWH